MFFQVGEGLSYTVEFELNNDILAAEIYKSNDSLGITLKSLMAIMLIDCVGQMKGYQPRDLTYAISYNEGVENYTLEKEGVEIKELR